MENPYELIYMSRMGDDWSQKALFCEFQPMQETFVNHLIKSYYALRCYKEEFLQEAMLSIFVAVNDYREDQKCSFKTFLELVTKRRIYTLLRHYSATSYLQPHHTNPLEEAVCETKVMYSAFPSGSHMEEPEYAFFYHEAQDRVLHFMKTLNERDQKILQSWLKGMSYKTASKSLNLTYKSYDGRLRRIKEKLKDVIEQEV